MNFSMQYPDVFSVKDRIELLERSILVNSFAYYELDENILEDYRYDANTVLLEKYALQFPADFIQSRYYKYFFDFCNSDGTHNSTGFDLLNRVRKDDAELYRHIHMDAALALDLKRRRFEPHT